MTTPLPAFRDVELELAGDPDRPDLHPGLLPTYLGCPFEWVDIEIPPALEDKLRADWGFFVRIGRVGGATSDRVTDRPVTDIDIMSASRNMARTVAVNIEQFLLSRPHPIDRCNVLMAPQMVPFVSRDAETTIRRFYASYHLSLRR